MNRIDDKAQWCLSSIEKAMEKVQTAKDDDRAFGPVTQGPNCSQ